MFRAMDVGRFLCSAGALGSPALLPSFSIITISLHISIILIITHLQSFYIYISIHLYNYTTIMIQWSQVHIRKAIAVTPSLRQHGWNVAGK